MTKGVLSSAKSQEVKLWLSPPKLASGNSSQENIHIFESLDETIRFTRVCELASFRHRVSAGMNYKTRPDEDEGFGQTIPSCREYTLSRAHPQSRIFAAIPGGTVIGPVIEVQIVKILEQYGLEIAIPSPNDHVRTSHVVKSIFPMPYSDLVQNCPRNFKNQEEESLAKNRPILASRRLVQSMFQVFLATRKLAQRLLAFLLQASLYTKRHIPTNERKWKVSHAHPPDGGDLAIAVSNVVTIMVRHYDQDE